MIGSPLSDCSMVGRLEGVAVSHGSVAGIGAAGVTGAR